MSLKKKFVLEFDEAPALIFVSHDGVYDEEIYKNGEKVRHWTGATIYSSLNDVTKHEITYLTAKEID